VNRKYMLVLGVLTFCLLMAVASPAFATTRKTRITGLATSVTTLQYRDTGTLTYARSGRNYAIAGQYVKVYRYVGGRWVYQMKTKTSTRGTFSVSKPSGYSYRFVFAGVRGRYYSCSWTTKVNPVVTGVEADVDSLALDGGEPATVSGELWMVSGTSRKPLAGAAVTISQSDTVYATTTTDEYGTWMVDLPGGDYRITYAGDRTHRSCTNTFTVAVGALTEVTSAQGSYVLGTGGTALVSGQVRTDYGTLGETWTPLGGATLTIRAGEEGTVIATAVSDSEGSWSAELPVGSYVVEYAAVQGFLGGDGIRYNMESGDCSLSVTMYPMLDAFADLSGQIEYLVGAPASGTIVLRNTALEPIPMVAPLTLKVLVWSDTAGEGGYGDYVLVDTITTDAGGAWTVSGLPAADEYILQYEEDPDHVVDGTHYYVQAGEWYFSVVSSLAPVE